MPRRGRFPLAARFMVLSAAVSLLAGCVQEPPQGDPWTLPEESDGGAPTDGATPTDGGTSPDGGAQPDGGASPDVGSSPDSDTPPDSGTEPSTDALDLLLVIDNSNSMCQLQKELYENLRSSLEALTARSANIHIGVTTTDMNENYPLEPVASPGWLQSQPQPLPGFDRACHHARDASGEPIPDDYSPIRANIERALDCTVGTDRAKYEFSDAEIECAMTGQPADCEIAGVCGASQCDASDLFPPPSDYRDVPRVIRVMDYHDGDALDLDRLTADLACATFVGTRGYGIEKGLSAAIAAVSPTLTGGSVEQPIDPTAPNAGFIRRDADFGLLFLTDENDCSHDGTLDETTTCGDDVCEFANKAGNTSTPLLAPSRLAAELIANLQQVKQDASFSADRLRVASIHGAWDRFDGVEATADQCTSATYDGVAPSCSFMNDGRRAYSGDRYERFVDALGAAASYPAANTDGAHRLGAACENDLAPVFAEAWGTLAP